MMEPTTPKGHPLSSPSPFRPRGTASRSPLALSSSSTFPQQRPRDVESNESKIHPPPRGNRKPFTYCLKNYLCPLLVCQVIACVLAYQIYAVVTTEQTMEGVSEVQRELSVKRELDRQHHQHLQAELDELKSLTESLRLANTLNEAKVDTLIKYGAGGGEKGEQLVDSLKEVTRDLSHKRNNVRKREVSPKAFAKRYEEKGSASTADYCSRPQSKAEAIEMNLGKSAFAEHGQDVLHRLSQSRIFIALNLKSNTEVMPHLLSQIVYVLSFFDIPNCYVSVYESGSEDETSTHLQDWVQILGDLGVQTTVKTTNEKRSEDEYRIDFLALMRNRAMQPLYESVWPDPVLRNTEGKHRSTFDYVWFINDILFCAEDAIRLFLYRDSHMTCALDLFYWAEPHNKLRLYDYWVARSRNGRRLDLDSPFIPDGVDPEARKLAEKWRAFPVSCCWNGMVVLDPNIFGSPHNVRFRSEGPNECAQSEVNHLCSDMWRAGYTNIILDPYVTNVYMYDHFNLLRDLKTSIRRPHIRSKPMYMDAQPNTTECCPHHRGEDDVRYEPDGRHECHDIPTHY